MFNSIVVTGVCTRLFHSKICRRLLFSAPLLWWHILFCVFLPNALPPIVASLCYGGMFLGYALFAVLTVQLSANLSSVLLFLLFPLNYIICSVRVIRKTVADYSAKIAETEYKNRFLNFCKRFFEQVRRALLLFCFFGRCRFYF